MTRRMIPIGLAALATVTFGTFGAGVAGSSPAAAAVSITPVISGLNNPRGLAVDGRGALYVAEAGPYGEPFSNEPQEGVTSGGVSKYVNVGTSSQSLVWKSNLPGLYSNANGIPEVIGASGVSAFGNGCMKNSNGNREGCSLVTIMGESQAGAGPVPHIGYLVGLNPGNGTATDLADVGDQNYAWTDDHQDLFPSDFPDSNPYGVLVTRVRGTGGQRTFVADAGANTVNEVLANGTVRVIAYIPNDGVRDATPTCVTQGPDGALYVGTLNLFKNGFGQNPGHSDVWRIDPDTSEGYLTAAQLWTGGLTTVTSCAFDSSGNFWATEMFANDVVRVPFANPGSKVRFGGNTTTPFPGGIAPAADGGMFVSINSLTFVPNSGAVVRIAG